MTVVIAGAGPTGLTVACGLLQHGIDVRVVDAAPGPATTSRAIGVQSRTVGVLRRLNALGDLPECAVSVRHLRLQVDNREVLAVEVDELFAPANIAAPMIVSQADTERVLRDRVEHLGGQIEWNTAVTGGRLRPAGVQVELSSGELLETDWLIGCDGAHSVVRKFSGATFSGARVDERFLLADLHLNDPSRATVMLWLRPGRVLALFPLPGGLWRIVANGLLGEGEQPDQAEIVDRIQDALQGVAGITNASVTGTEWTSDFRISERLTTRYRLGRVLLAGDAAHIHSPVGGQGMNTGIGDAENLAWKLALVVDGSADEVLLDTYQAERRPVARNVLKMTGFATRVGVSSNRVITWARNRVVLRLLPYVGNLPLVQHRIARALSQTDVSYRRGVSHLLHRGLAAGDPVPDVVVDAEGHTLYQHIGRRWAVIASTLSEAERHAKSARIWLGNDSVAALTTSDARLCTDVLLVRPDGHLAWRSGKRTGTIDFALNAVLGPKP